MKGKTVCIYFKADKKCRQVIKLSELFDSSVKDLVHSVTNGDYHSFEVL